MTDVNTSHITSVVNVLKKHYKKLTNKYHKDGTIFVDDDVKRGSKLFNRAIKHEQKHIDQIEEGRAAYGDNWVMWQGKVYIRKNGMIDGPAGRLPEGHPNHPWEQEAIQAEKK